MDDGLEYEEMSFIFCLQMNRCVFIIQMRKFLKRKKSIFIDLTKCAWELVTDFKLTDSLLKLQCD